MKSNSYVIYKCCGKSAMWGNSVTFLNKTRFLQCIMVSGKHKSRTMRKVFVRTPGSKTVVQYRRRNPAKAQCSSCGKQLAGVPRALPSRMRNMPKTSKRPQRPFGGVLCSSCSRKEIIKRARKK